MRRWCKGWVAAMLICALVCLTLTAQGATLTLGSRGERVALIQQRLKDWGDYQGAVDGVFGMLTINALTAADGVIIPMQCEYFALEGLTQLSATISKIKKRYNPRLFLSGILVTMFNARLSLSTQVMAELKTHYGDRVFETTISRNVKLCEAPSFGKPIIYYDKSAKGAQQYLQLAKELLERA